MAMIPYKDFIAADKKDNIWIPDTYERKQKKKTKIYCDDIICFDTESCNFFVSPDGKVYSINDIFKLCNYHVPKIEKCFETFKAGALPYIWQCSINDWVLYGRELPEFNNILTYIKEKTAGAETHVWIHNISWEYQFLREIMQLDDKFFTEARKPLNLKQDGLVFRCSYRLTNLSLAKWGEQIGVDKAVGDLDYHALYTPWSELGEQPMHYCEQDLRVMIAGIRNYKKQYKHIKDIPFTQTGIPRRDIKKLGRKTPGFTVKVAKMQPKTAEEWKIYHATYAGGLTLINPDHAGILFQCHTPGAPGYINVSSDPDNPISQRSIDRKSAYPAAMLEKYPSSAFFKTSEAPTWEDGNHHLCLLEFRNLKARYDVTPWSASKRIMIQGATYNPDGLSKNNGKIIKCDRYAGYFLETDYQLLKMFYTWDECIVHSHRVALSDYMDKHVVEYMLKRYEAKTLRKTDPDPTIYNLEKQKLNSIYGMCGTALIHDDIIEDGWDFHTRHKSDEEIIADLKKLQDYDYNNVLPYIWGCYVTSHQRYALMSTLARIGETPKEALAKLSYTDTDSGKGSYTDADMQIVDNINQRIIEWTEKRLKDQGIDPELARPKDKKGRPQHLGTWENDANYYEILYLRAKAYAYRQNKNDITHITLAGVPKAAGCILQSPADLKEGLYFDIFQSRKNLCQYIDGDNPQVIMPDGYQVTNKCGCVIRPTSYTLKLDNEYRQLIKYYISQKHH